MKIITYSQHNCIQEILAKVVILQVFVPLENKYVKMDFVHQLIQIQLVP